MIEMLAVIAVIVILGLTLASHIRAKKDGEWNDD